MFRNLNCAMLGVRVPIAEQIALAARHGFAGIDFSIDEALELSKAKGIEGVRALFADANVKPGLWSFPLNFREDEETWRKGLELLPKQAKLAADLGCMRTATFIGNSHDERDFRSNFAFHVERLRPAAQILKEHGHRLGLEFVGPKTLRDRRRHLFIYTLDGMLALGAAIGTGNVGLLLDIWHLYTSHGTVDDLRKLEGEDIVTAHINDAQAGKDIDEQIDNQRALPGETGVLDSDAFLGALQEIGYDGPVTAEPFSQRVRDMPAEQAVAETAAAMNKVWRALD